MQIIFCYQEKPVDPLEKWQITVRVWNAQNFFAIRQECQAEAEMAETPTT